jgi:DNA polymerase-3 subunit epsilon
MREIVFDTETTGLSPADGHRLVEIGCVELVHRVETGRVFHAYFNPGRPMPAEAAAIHGLTDSFLADKGFFPDSLRELLDFLGDDPLVAHNATFDFNFLNHELRMCGRVHLCPTRMVDTLAMARMRHPGAKHSLDALCTRYGIDRTQRIKHGALLDAQLLAQLYVELTGGRQIGFMLGADIAPAAGAKPRSADLGTGGRAVRPPRPHRATDAELNRHAAFLSTITSPLWREAPPLG